MLSFLVIFGLVAAASAEDLFPHGRIVGGENAVIETYPYQIEIEILRDHHCGGSIIATNWVLTAGHCVAYSVNYFKIRAGSSILQKGGSVHHVDKIIRHENYTMNLYGVPFNDIALLHVKEPFKFDETRQPISLFEPAEESTPGVQAVVTGWGDTMQSEYDGQLQTVSIPIVSKELCNTAYKRVGGIPEGQICASYYGVGGKDTCQGDSGGPLAINGRLAGVVSWGNGCATAEYPGCYTEVAAYRDWIKEHANI